MRTFIVTDEHGNPKEMSEEEFLKMQLEFLKNQRHTSMNVVHELKENEYTIS